jgi:beta-galactosidase GanA
MLTASHYQMVCVSALAAGAAGWNWYMLVNRDNWYQSPINEWGRVRPDIFTAFSKMLAVIKAIQPHTLIKQTRTAITYDPLQRATVRPAQNLLQAFYEAGVDYEFFDLAGGECTQDVLFYAGSAWLSQERQQKLLSYVKQGGHLVLLGAYPYLDDYLNPCNELGIPEPDGVIKGLPNLSLDLSINGTCQTAWLFHYEKVPGEAIKATRKPPENLVAEENKLQWNLQVGQDYTIGYSKSIDQGTITMIGVEPSPDLILSLQLHLQKKNTVRSITPGIQTSLFKRGNDYYVFVINTTQEDKTVVLTFDPTYLQAPPQYSFDMVSGRLFRLESELTGFVAQKSGAVIRLEREKL